VLTVDLHAGQIQGFFDIPTDNLYAMPSIARDIKDYLGVGDHLMVVSPDVGGVVRARALAKRLGGDLAIVGQAPRARRRVGSDEHHRQSRGALLHPGRRHRRFRRHHLHAAEALMKAGAKEVCAYAVHGVLSGGAVARVQSSVLKSMVVTDSIAATTEVMKCSNIRRISIAG